MLATLLATVFGAGRAPFAPGTVASVVALPFAWMALAQFGANGVYVLAGASVVAYLLGVWATGVYAARIGKTDPSECVIDEVAGQWLACATAPLSLAGFAVAFLTFRLLDIAKPWPVSWGETLPRGWGVMTDDMIAGLIVAILIAVLRSQGIL